VLVVIMWCDVIGVRQPTFASITLVDVLGSGYTVYSVRGNGGESSL